ncbi:cbb3-type cytochrome c oxidase N-terminal domain-containing protein [Mucilaginibacter xinganensis]|uniref:Cbb3-type cytochrome c oxidase subunit CcoP2 n=1 Tax=Mucilaginibacter xinganensis TaxID=1234841 RepID=A0A223NQL5_9SPHI|nr:cbb3-type cytochrome c oxidase N-terminal domain-containing protein [Mucilaginibacter xinganensis]ASU31958.1 Cbb3-type cytochrome c oxidase subunit CcoP2 [Mucilaginibacter xinganensis]
MKYLRITLFLAFTVVCQGAFAADTVDDHSMLTPGQENAIGYGVVVGALLMFIIVMLVLLRTFKVLTRIIMKYEGYTDQQITAEFKPAKIEKKAKEKGAVWNKLLSLRPLSEEKDLLIEHDYDGIQELDNPIPAWFMYLFYATIAFSVSYLLIYHVFGVGQLQYDEYKTEVAQAETAKKIYLSKQANQVDENTVKLVTDPAVIGSGQTVFKTTCAPCHGDKAQGNVGPNLTDDYWLHGGKITDIFKTIKYGVLAKGMPTWEKQLSPKQISDVANYIKSLHGTNPPGAKAPQGDKEKDDDHAEKKGLISAVVK